MPTKYLNAQDSTAIKDNLFTMHFLSAENAINTFGLIGIFVILFLETGLPLVIGLPGDSLLFLAGVAASGTGEKLNVKLSLAPLAIGSLLADSVTVGLNIDSMYTLPQNRASNVGMVLSSAANGTSTWTTPTAVGTISGTTNEINVTTTNNDSVITFTHNDRRFKLFAREAQI